MTTYAKRISDAKYKECMFAILMALTSPDIASVQRDPAYVGMLRLNMTDGSVQLLDITGLISKPVKVGSRWKWPELDYSKLMHRTCMTVSV
jgi:hypothetical protein